MSLDYWEMTPDQLKAEDAALLVEHNLMRDALMLAHKQKRQAALRAEMSRKCGVLDHKRFMIHRILEHSDELVKRVLCSDQCEMIYIVSESDYDLSEVMFTTHDAAEAFEFFLLERESVNNIKWYKMGSQK